MRHRHSFAVGAAVLLLTTSAAGFAWSAVAADPGTINGCYQKNEGQLRVVTSIDACHPSELPISWNTQGAKGSNGEQGAPGRDGRNGADGAGVTVEPEPPGANCPTGGQKVIAANGVGYVCNAGPPPDPGEDM